MPENGVNYAPKFVKHALLNVRNTSQITAKSAQKLAENVKQFANRYNAEYSFLENLDSKSKPIVIR